MSKPMPKPKPQEQESTDGWATALVKGATAICLKLIDKGQFFLAVVFFLLLAAVVLLGILMVRMPAQEISPFLRACGRVLMAGALPYSLVANLIQVRVIYSIRRIYKTEVRREGDAKGRLEKIVDPDRTGSGHDIGEDS
jgi:hypothetical protein